jgi:predicted dehydrogenase
MKILFTGLGSIGKRHARLLREHPQEFDLLAYRSGSTTKEAFDEIEEYCDLNEALASKPDVAFITNPTHRHVDTAIQCAQRDCHLFIEKPLSHTLEGVNKLIDEVNERDLITLMGCQLRFDPVLRKTRELLQSEQFGEVLSFRVTAGSYLPDWRPDQDYRQSYSADPKKGGGVVLDLIHEIDYIYWLFDYPIRVLSEIKYTDTLEIESEAIAEAIVTMEDDILGSIHLDYCRREPQRQFDIVCERGSITADLESKELITESSSSTTREPFEYDRDERFQSQLEYFLEHVNNGISCENDVREGKEVLKFALQIKTGAIND